MNLNTLPALAFIFFFALSPLIGQNNVRVFYEETNKSFDLNKFKNMEEMPLTYAQIERINREKRSEKIIYSLQLIGKESVFRFESKEIPWLKDSNNQGLKEYYKNSNEKQRRPNYFKNLNEQNLWVSGGSLPSNYMVEDNLTSLNKWELLPMDSLISGFQCKAAKYLGTKDVMAWYTPDIPVSDGPKHYSGLPGLIVALKQEDGKILAINRIEKLNSDECQPLPELAAQVVTFAEWRRKFLRSRSF